MSPVADFLSKSDNARVWAEIRDMTAANGMPGALLAIVDSESAKDVRDLYARIALCDSGSGEDGCPSCMAWREDGHPDLVIAGDGLGSPGIADCIEMQAIMSLKPFAAKGKLGVIMSADQLSLPAANSLLKIAEEPPEGGHLLLIAEHDNLIPTIKSRAWTFHFHAIQAGASLKPPSDPFEWLAWIERTKKLTQAEVASEADAWSRWLAESGEWHTASLICGAIYISQKRHMPVSMVQDAMFAILREGVPIGQIFGDVW